MDFCPYSLKQKRQWVIDSKKLFITCYIHIFSCLLIQKKNMFMTSVCLYLQKTITNDKKLNMFLDDSYCGYNRKNEKMKFSSSSPYKITWNINQHSPVISAHVHVFQHVKHIMYSYSYCITISRIWIWDRLEHKYIQLVFLLSNMEMSVISVFSLCICHIVLVIFSCLTKL